LLELLSANMMLTVPFCLCLHIRIIDNQHTRSSCLVFHNNNIQLKYGTFPKTQE
jgi:hypothetical protein